MNGKSILKIIAIVFLVILLLAGAVIAIFNGIVEVIEEVLGNIVDFLSNPLTFLSQFAQDAWNTIVTINPFDNGRQLSI